MNAETRDTNRCLFDNAAVKNKEAYESGVAMTRAILNISASDRHERTFGRLKWLARGASAALFAVPVFAEIATKTAELIGHSIENDASVPNTLPFAIGAYAVSRLCRFGQNVLNEGALEERKKFVHAYGDLGVGVVQQLRTDYDCRTLMAGQQTMEEQI